ncbi:molybdopterin-binding protein [Salipiger sp. P9]|uniref:molybdopterin-binding protein n=1 Tax=Salipiger pentaromativorans TaxID=2943193 RepID=UPI0021573C8E|nr:molybdopterin-binding protein [Salipiger pentaromativorans]MCR8547048.1 molybdopterin-binding protein [Salipiger pentaromativorans]
MKFGAVPLAEAVGGVLAHSVALPDGRLRKGRVIAPEDLAPLEAAGIAELVVARLEAGDVGEDAAAARLAQALVPDPDGAGLRLGRAATGRVNIHSTDAGVIEIDAARIDAVNAVHPMITVATVPPWKSLPARGMAATIKIISYAVPGTALEAACAAAPGALRLRPVRLGRAALIETSIGGEVPAKGRRAIRARLERFGVTLTAPVVVPHETAPLAAAIAASDAEIVLILTGSATSDSLDTAPEALRAAGGTVTHFGMPVDPGNLLFFGALGDKPVIGLPGCARSPALNGADWVLERILCGVEVSARDIMGMGVGGLLKEPPSRPRPRES